MTYYIGMVKQKEGVYLLNVSENKDCLSPDLVEYIGAYDFENEKSIKFALSKARRMVEARIENRDKIPGVKILRTILWN